jgi:hypothetical protein
MAEVLQCEARHETKTCRNETVSLGRDFSAGYLSYAALDKGRRQKRIHRAAVYLTGWEREGETSVKRSSQSLTAVMPEEREM